MKFMQAIIIRNSQKDEDKEINVSGRVERSDYYFYLFCLDHGFEMKIFILNIIAV